MPAVDVEIASPEGTRTVTALVGPTIIVGRGSDANLVLPHDDVSRRHAALDIEESGVVVRDLSTNGTFVEGRRVASGQAVPFGKALRIGPFVLRVTKSPVRVEGSG
jgi:pSer/pThr/pTyr-binding forkhead associated (FHA) protein